MCTWAHSTNASAAIIAAAVERFREYLRCNTAHPDPRAGYASWHCSTAGAPLDANPASDGETFLVSALLFAAARWGDGWCPFFAAPTMSKLNQDTGIHTVEQLAGKIAALHGMRAAAGKDGAFSELLLPSEPPAATPPVSLLRLLPLLRDVAPMALPALAAGPPAAQLPRAGGNRPRQSGCLRQ